MKCKDFWFGIMLLVFTSCENPDDTVLTTVEPQIETSTVINGFEIIWGMDVLPNGDLIFGEKRGKMYLLKNNQTSPIEISGVPTVDAGGQGGLLDIRVHPEYSKNGWIYFSYTASTPYHTLKLSRFRLVNDQIESLQNIYTATGPGGHNGSRILFDRNNFLYLSIGEGPSTGGGASNTNKNASDPTSPWGKIHRFFDQGGFPTTNPVLPGNASFNSIFSYGHRNPQGLALDPITGQVYSTEHGPKGGDEINLIQPGANYGWPQFSLGINYDGSVISDSHSQAGITAPIYSWSPSIGTCGMTFIKGNKFKSWSGNLLVAGLASQKLHRCVMKNNQVTGEFILLEGLGRVRNVIQAPDESIYVSVEGPGRILKITPIP
ncbi:MAG: PQQ-dependent sugar dehydrogenase [Bacteroidetes bacterium]|nr:PQQ-dependent sugar dehydrogenase [Bacteroidota bacterium]